MGLQPGGLISGGAYNRNFTVLKQDFSTHSLVQCKSDRALKELRLDILDRIFFRRRKFLLNGIAT